MSRSYKKPWIKDPANRYMKKVSSRMMRSNVNQILQVFKTKRDSYDIGPDIPDRKVKINQYNICDFIFYCKDNKATRK